MLKFQFLSYFQDRFRASLVLRVWIAVGVLLLTVTLVSIVLLQSLNTVQGTLHEVTSTHFQTLVDNSEISRRVLVLISRIELLDKIDLQNNETLVRESITTDALLQDIRTLSTGPEMSEPLDRFLSDANRLVGSAISLSAISRGAKEADYLLGKRLGNIERSMYKALALEYAQGKQGTQEKIWQSRSKQLNESWLLVGKYVASLNNRLNSEQVTLIVDQAKQQLENINNEVYMIKNSKYQYNVGIDTISDASFGYSRVLKKLYVNLLQHSNFKSSLLASQNELLTAVKSYEKQARHAAAKIQISVDGLLTELLNTTVLVMIIMVGISLLLVARFIHLHIRVPIKHIINCIEKFEAEETKQLVSLDRQDEWDTIEKSFNKMSLRLNDSYQQIRSEQNKFNYLAYHDTLTGLDNRRSILQKLVQIISEAEKENREFAIMYMDLDQFKRVNDSLGHSIGDGLLTEVARRLSLILKDIGLAARLGGDEFLVLTPNISTVSEALAFAKTINDSLSESYNLDSQNIFITNSIGICFYPKDGHDVETLIRNSDTALYHAKRSGRDCSKLYENQMTSHAHQLISQNSGIRNALENEQFVLYFQPKYNMQTGDICGAEALIRWQHPDLGILLPIKFLPVAEETGLITDIDDWVFRNLCEQIVSWQKQGLAVDDMRFCCNFSGRQFLTNNLREKLVGIMVQTKAKPGWIEIEITEQDAMTNLTACAATMKELLDEGLELAIDDFGTGYSSLNYLKHLPATTLKIDRSFVQDMCTNRTDLAIVQSIISLAHNMDMRIIAEGIEEKNQVDRLISMGCIHGQGYYFSQPLPAADFLELLQNKPLLEMSLSN